MSKTFVENYIDRGTPPDEPLDSYNTPSGEPLDSHNNPDFRNEMQALVYLQTLVERLIKDDDTITFLIGLQHILEEQRCRPDFITQVSNWKEQLLRERQLHRLKNERP